jgi:hypothetical protein
MVSELIESIFWHGLLKIHLLGIQSIVLTTSFSFFIVYSFIHMCIHCLGYHSPLPLAPSFSLPPPSLPGRTCSALFSNFIEEKI